MKVSRFPYRLIAAVLGFALALFLAFQLDHWWADLLRQPISSGQTKAVLRAMRCWGEGATLVILATGLYLAQKHRWKEIVSVMVAVLICAGTVDLIKPFFARHRPNQVLDIRQGSANPDPDGWNSSFPSGHTATAFSFASGLSVMYPPLRPLCIVAASGTAMSRMYDQRHWLSDCVAGAALGWFLGGLLVRKLSQSLTLNNMTITPVPETEKPADDYAPSTAPVSKAA